MCVSPELLRDLVQGAKDLRLGPPEHFFTSRKTEGATGNGAPMTRQHARWLLRRAAGRGRGHRPRGSGAAGFPHRPCTVWAPGVRASHSRAWRRTSASCTVPRPPRWRASGSTCSG